MEPPGERQPHDPLDAARVVLDDRHQLLAQLVERRERERIHHREALGEDLIPQLDGGPPGEVVAVRGREQTVAKEVAVGMEEDRVARDRPDAVEQLARVEKTKGSAAVRILGPPAAGSGDTIGLLGQMVRPAGAALQSSARTIHRSNACI